MKGDLLDRHWTPEQQKRFKTAIWWEGEGGEKGITENNLTPVSSIYNICTFFQLFSIREMANGSSFLHNIKKAQDKERWRERNVLCTQI